MCTQDRLPLLERRLRNYRRVLALVACLALVTVGVGFIGPLSPPDPEAFKVTTPNLGGTATTRLQVSGNEDNAKAAFLNSDVGIGTASPGEKLEVTGAVKIGAAAGTADGTIRWTGTDFEGRKGGAWVSLTQGGSSTAKSFMRWSGGEAGTATISWADAGTAIVGVSTTNGQYSLPTACTITNLRARVNTAKTGNGTITWTIRKNNVATSLSVSRSGTSTGDTTTDTDTVSFAAGDEISIAVVYSNDTDTGSLHGTALVEVRIQ
jgi:hypothetical protein